MPASRSGRRSESVWKTKASISMPTPAMAQAIMAPNGPVSRAKVCGSEKMPAPTIDPTTIAVRVQTENLCWRTVFWDSVISSCIGWWPAGSLSIVSAI